MDDALIAPAEEPAIWSPEEPEVALAAGDGFTLVARRERATVERVRLDPAGVAAAVARARAMARARGLRELVWWVGPLARPAGIAGALAAEGLVPFAEEPELAVLAIDRVPDGPADVEVRPVADLRAYRAALEVEWAAWGMPPGDRARRRRDAARTWDAQEASGRVDHHLAVIDGRPAGVSRLVATDTAGALMGGAVVPWARGRGAYRALVHARWHAAAARGTPRLVTAAGAMSAPVLRRIGFRELGRVRLLADPLV